MSDIPPQKIDVNVQRQAEDYGNVTARSFFSGFGVAVGVVFGVFAAAVAIVVATIVGLIILFRPEGSRPVNEALLLPPPQSKTQIVSEPEKPIYERVVDFAEQCVADRLSPGEGRVFGRGNIVESDVNDTYLIAGRTSNYVEWKVRVEVVDDAMGCGSVVIRGEDRTEQGE